MIPKKIHYCWFGKGEKTSSMLKCIESWRQNCPDYEIIEWNEDNFDVNCIRFVSEAYSAKKWAFVADYARLKIVYENGGIYFDTDVEVLKSYDELLKNEAFAGFQGSEYIATGLGFGAIKGHPVIKALMEDYHNRSFPSDQDEQKKIACPIINTRVLYELGFEPSAGMQEVCGLMLYPAEYFDPKDSETYELSVTEKTYSIHHYDSTWKSGNARIKQLIIKLAVRMLGKKAFINLKNKLK